MRVSCPACQAEMSLDVLLGREADAQAVANFITRHVGMGDLLVRYVALFRPAKRRLALARVVALLQELMPDIERGAIARKGRDWPVTADTWRAGIEAIFAKRDKGTLTLPLTSHGLLYEVMCSLADKAEAQAEAQTEAQRRDHRTTGQAVGPVAAVLAVKAGAAAAAPLPDYSRPSSAALRLKAQMAAAQAARTSGTAAAAPQPDTQQPAPDAQPKEGT
jgi:hypothetical protein